MTTSKKILITAVGAPGNGYKEVEWAEKPDPIKTPFPFLMIASKMNVDQILLLGTQKALNQARPHYQQLLKELDKFGLLDRLTPKEIGALNTREEFWEAFHEVTKSSLFKGNQVDLIIDLTFGYRVQPMLIFLSAYFLSETRPNVHLKRVFYGMEQTDPPHILDMTELIYLLDWLKATQLFIKGGSAQGLVERIKIITSDKFPQFVEAFEDFTYAYGFNYVNHLKQKSNRFLQEQTKEVKRFFRENYPVFEQIRPFLKDFVEIFQDKDELRLQLNSARRNFNDGAYSRSVLILRESFITFFCQAFGYSTNKDRQKVERILINRVYWSLTNRNDKPNLSEKERHLAQKTFEILAEVFSSEKLMRYYELWDKIRDLRNGAGHIKNFDKNREINFIELKQDFFSMLEQTEKLFNEMRNQFNKCKAIKEKIDELLKEPHIKKVFIIVNQGVHPIVEDLKKQFGENIEYEIITEGNINLTSEAKIVQRVKEIVYKNKTKNYVLVPSGIPYLITIVYNTLWQMTSKHPIYLQYDRETGEYKEKILDPRKFL